MAGPAIAAMRVTDTGSSAWSGTRIPCLYMTGPRTYDTVSGRFLQGDPLAATRFDVSPFVYASASPVGRLDPGGYADGSNNTFDPDELSSASGQTSAPEGAPAAPEPPAVSPDPTETAMPSRMVAGPGISA